jgi:hypothetical protein
LVEKSYFYKEWGFDAVQHFFSLKGLQAFELELKAA